MNSNNNISLDYNVPFNKIVIDMANLHEKKNKDYGNAFGQLFNEYGLNYSIMHLHEKLNRIKSVHKNNSANNESIKDSLIDLANYAVMTLVELNNLNYNQCEIINHDDNSNNITNEQTSNNLDNDPYGLII